jgi:hypothetical protein
MVMNMTMMMTKKEEEDGENILQNICRQQAICTFTVITMLSVLLSSNDNDSFLKCSMRSSKDPVVLNL